MIFSDAFPTIIKGRAAQVRVIRNDGNCWGRLIYQDGREFDIYTKRDYYEHADEDASEAFIRAAKRGQLDDALGWPIGWGEGEA